MSKLRYGEDCIFLDAARRKFLEACGECLKAGWLLQRRLRSMRSHVVSPISISSLAEQFEKIDWLIAGLEDFKDYMEEEEAWAPREEPSRADGRDGPDGPVADHVDGYRVLPGEEANAAMDELLEAMGGQNAK